MGDSEKDEVTKLEEPQKALELNAWLEEDQEIKVRDVSQISAAVLAYRFSTLAYCTFGKNVEYVSLNLWVFSKKSAVGNR
jgi:hypothetical protein